MTTVSVIVPVYNVADYLTQCVESIVGQSYTQLEILLVDDGSTDNSGHICDQWAQRDSRVRVIHKANGGLSDARNAALEVMTGELVTMVDGDDYISPDCVEVLLGVMRQTESDIVVGQWRMFDNGEDQPSTSSDGDKVTVYARDEAIDSVFYQNTLTNSVCSRLMRASLFDHVRFPKGKLYEDLAVVYPLLQQVGRVAYTTHLVYHYRQHAASITGHFTVQRTHVLDILEALERQVSNEAPQHLPAVQSRLLSAYFNILLLCPGEAQYRSVTDRCWDGIRRLRWSCLRDPQVRLKNKFGILASLAGKRVLTGAFGQKS